MFVYVCVCICADVCVFVGVCLFVSVCVCLSVCVCVGGLVYACICSICLCSFVLSVCVNFCYRFFMFVRLKRKKRQKDKEQRIERIRCFDFNINYRQQVHNCLSQIVLIII